MPSFKELLLQRKQFEKVDNPTFTNNVRVASENGFSEVSQLSHIDPNQGIDSNLFVLDNIVASRQPRLAASCSAACGECFGDPSYDREPP